MILIQIFLFFNAILFSIATTPEIQNQIDQLSKSTRENILNILLSTSSSRNDLKDTSANWCCQIDPGVQATSQTRQTTYYIAKHGRHKCGYDSCGFLGFGRCTRWCDEYWTEAQHGVETYIVYTQNICPHDHVICCAQHIYVIGHCFSYTEIYNNQQLFAQLNELGIVIPGPSVG
ncbi:unnamed protein product [Rotaria sp. Silwood1]|nr:unnamed protein product [Rotaria sp. Silwood1]CAF3334547.1 unnamed protein product [Rotaria sp. Silwood1]CAF3350880.1 unnamed protein product [Rotaria sp. Silwood1]CAF3355678.1 unnamed protein product [Rotaria sp. Silwood1]CAF4636115.1 unnamed protein product [Rotaria sp. Silwood1]